MWRKELPRTDKTRYLFQLFTSFRAGYCVLAVGQNVIQVFVRSEVHLIMGQFSIIIVGAGPVGLAAAICLVQKGHCVQVLQRKRDLSLTGGGLILGPNATRTLLDWGLGPAMQTITDEFEATKIRRYDGGAAWRRRNDTASSLPYCSLKALSSGD